MSLVRIALRMLAVKALKDRTVAGKNVLDSEIGILGEDEKGLHIKPQKGRFIAVYTDDAEAKPDEQRAFHENGLVNLCLEYGVTDSMQEEVDDPDRPGSKMKVIFPTIPHASRMHDFYLDILGRQIRSGLSDGQNEAAEVLRGLIRRVVKITCERAGSDRTGERVAAQKLTFTVDALQDPQFLQDAPEGAPFSRFLALLAAGDADDQKLGALILDQIPESPEDLEEARQRIGLTLKELGSLGFEYVPDADEDSEITNVTIDVAGSQPVEVGA